MTSWDRVRFVLAPLVCLAVELPQIDIYLSPSSVNEGTFFNGISISRCYFQHCEEIFGGLLLTLA